MKNVRVKQKSRGPSSSLSEIIGVVLIAAVCIAGTFLLTSSYYKNLVQASSEPEVEMVSVAVANEDLADGSYVKNDEKGVSAYSMVELPVTEVPENAVTSPSDMNGLVTKLHIAPNTVITSDMLVAVDMDEDLSSTSHQVAVNYVTLNSKIESGTYIDIMLKTYSTEGANNGYADKVVLAKKKVLDISGKTIYLNLDREEELQLGIASVEAAAKTNDNNKDEKKVLYAVALSSPSQPKAIETYENAELASLIESDPNLIREAQETLAQQAEQDAEAPTSNIETVG